MGGVVAAPSRLQYNIDDWKEVGNMNSLNLSNWNTGKRND
jgi:hypothetical protein